MSQNDSFIDEVTEEVRRDQLFRFFRRYGWVAIVLVLVLVGGAAVREYKLSQDRAAAEALGDAIFQAVRIDNAEARATALASIEAEGDAGVLAGLIGAAALSEANQIEAALDKLAIVAATPGLEPRYRDLAILRRAVIGADIIPAAERTTALEAIATPGAPYRLQAEEQLALIEVETGQTEAAIERLRLLLDDQQASSGLRDRASGVIVALGGAIGPDADN